MLDSLYQADCLRHVWSQSKRFRRILVVVLVFVVLRLGVQATLVAETISEGEIGGSFAADLQTYLDGAKHFQNREHLYLQGSLEEIEKYFSYAPIYAVIIVPLTWISPGWVPLVAVILHILAYILTYLWWDRIFRRLKLDRAREMLAWTLPVWLVCSAFWGDLNYLNIYVIMGLLGTLLIGAVLEERLGWAVLWLTLILITKPHWAFALGVPLLLGRYRFFIKLVAASTMAYLAVFVATLLIFGPEYGLQEYREYLHFLGRLSRDFPWRDTGDGFIGYNHSVAQIVVYILGVSRDSLRAATVIKLLLLLPLALVAVRYMRRPDGRPGYEVPHLGLDWAFALYLGAFIWLDMVWELSLGVALFTYLLATLEDRREKLWVWIVFLPYALVDVWQIISYLAFGDAVLKDDAYVLTDPSIYLPLIMIIILLFYVLLLKRLWAIAPSLKEAAARQQV